MMFALANAQWPSPLEVVKLYRGLAHGLSQMHRHRRIVHGDIKPGNLVLATGTQSAGDDRLRYRVDGRADRAARPGRRHSRYYAAPELLRKNISFVDGRADQFSATVVAYEMLTGVRPYGEIGGEAGLDSNRAMYEPLYRPPSQLSPMRRQSPSAHLAARG